MKDKVILVTGSNEGIGYATARQCYEQGAKMVLHGLDPAALEDSARRLGPDVPYITADLNEAASPKKIIDFVLSEFGQIDGLVNNAGLLDRCTLETATAELTDKMFAVNFRAPLMLIQAAVAEMKQRGTKGAIVNIGSVNAACGAENLLVYSATKAALETITKNLGARLTYDQIRINQLNVGWTATESEHRIQLAEGQPENWQDVIPRDFRPSGRLLTADDIARHAAFWLSDDSAPVTGQVYEVEQYPIIGRSFGKGWSEE